MSDYPVASDGTLLVTEHSAGSALECRECQVICELVVAPWRCVRGGRPCLYAHSDDDTTYLGCVHKVFLPELDASALEDADGAVGRGDPYGLVRVFGAPRPQCPVTVERAYGFKAESGGCVNPAFLRDAFSVAAMAGTSARATERLDGCGSGL